MSATGVDVILCGYERGGTTLLSEIFRANGYESGFECGVLLAPSPQQFSNVKPYWDMLLNGWGISEETRARASERDFAGFYKVLCDAAFPDHGGGFFDKTPKYMECLGTARSRAPFARKAVVIHRDPRAVFLSMSKRLSPTLGAEQAVEKNFTELTRRYLSYFTGSIAHLNSDDVLFVPFEELVSREDAWLKTLGLAIRGAPFIRRTARARFENVTSSAMDLGKVIEYDHLLGKALQDRILDATRLASLFFADPVSRAGYGGLWAETSGRINTILTRNDLPRTGMTASGAYFEPFTYLLRYPDVLAAGMNPVVHYTKNGIRERRRPA